MKYELCQCFSSLPVKNPPTIAQGLMQELKTHARIVIRTFKCTAKIPVFVILNSIKLVCQDRRHPKVAHAILQSCGIGRQEHCFWELLTDVPRILQKSREIHHSHSCSSVVEHLWGCL